MFSNQFAYVNTKLRSRLSKCLTDEQLESLIKAPSISEAVLLLRGTYYEAYDKAYEEAGDLRLAELAIAREEINLFKGAYGGLFERRKSFYQGAGYEV
jgi:vacuolar-type H+-ATPase subunit C/Vma6